MIITDSYCAIRQLQQSEGGKRAMRELYRFLKNGGADLPSRDKEAVYVILSREFDGSMAFRNWGDIHLAEAK